MNPTIAYEPKKHLNHGLLHHNLDHKIAHLDDLVKQHYPTHFVHVHNQIKKCVEHVLTLFPTKEIQTLILKAIEFAILEQNHLFRKDGSPIIIYEVEAACLLASVTLIQDADLFVASLLHRGQFDRNNDHQGNSFTQADLECIERHFSKRASEILAAFDSLPLYNTPESREAVIQQAASLSPAVQNLWLVARLVDAAFTQESPETTKRLLDAMSKADQKLKDACRTQRVL